VKTSHSSFVLILLFSALLAGCAAVPSAKQVPTAFDMAKQNYLKRAAEAEGKGELVEALKFYKLALTVDPEDTQGRAALTRVETALNEAALRHYEAGIKLRENGNYNLARKEFLTALRLKPDYNDAYKMLTDKTHVVTKKFIVHVVKPGESISKLAQMYYGDYRKFPVIAAFNGLGDAADVKAGQQIRIPSVDGLEPSAPDAMKSGEIKETFEIIEPSDDEFFAFTEQKDQPLKDAKREKQEERDQVAGYRDYALELFQQKKYEEAAAELDKVLAAMPEDQTAREYAYKAHFESALRLFEEKDYIAARDKFKTSLSYKTDCQKCHSYIRQCEDSYKEFHYRNGMKLFQDQHVQEALLEWEMVAALDPSYKRTPQMIEKAKTIIKKLEELKKSR